MSESQLLVFTDRPVIQVFFSGLRQLEGQSLVIKSAPVTVEALTNHTQEVTSATVTVVDVAPDPVAAIQVCWELHSQYPGLPILGMICCKRQVSLLHIQALVAAGVTSLLDSFVTLQEVMHVLKRVARGHTVVQLELSGDQGTLLADIVDSHTKEGSKSSLNIFKDEDVCLLDLVAHGLSDRNIAQQLHMSPPTVHHHIQHLCKIRGARNRTELAAWAGMWGFYRSSLYHGGEE